MLLLDSLFFNNRSGNLLHKGLDWSLHMPAIASLVANDGATTPVAHTFSPVGINADMVAQYDDRSPGVAVGYNSLTVSLRKPSNGSTSRNYKAVIKLVLPTLEITSPSTSTGISPQPTKAFDCLANVEFVFSERSSLQNRKDLLALVKNILAHATITSVVQDLENVY
jgi:hypothetical protein